MSKIVEKMLWLSPVAVATSFTLSTTAFAEQTVEPVTDLSPLPAASATPIATEQPPLTATSPTDKHSPIPTLYSQSPNSSLSPEPSISPAAENASPNPLSQVTSVSQLSDVQPTDWAFQALQSLVERYGCIAGYPDGTFRGNRALTRYEFAAGLNACLDRVNELIKGGTNSFINKEDLLALQRLQEEFAAELSALRGRLDSLETRTAELEANQFSTTTKLNGEVIFGLAGIVAGENAVGRRADRSTTLGSRVRLNFDTSFSGKDLLRTRLQAVNMGSFSTNSTFTPEGELRFNSGPFGAPSTDIGLDALLYQFPLSKRTTVILEANAGAADDFTNTVNPFFDGDGAKGALSNFATRNPIYYHLSGAGIGLKQEFGDRLELSLGYLAPFASNPSRGRALFNGPYGAIAQATFKPSDSFTLGLTYVHAYNITTNTGSNAANFPYRLDFFGIDTDKTLPVSSNSYGLEASWQLNRRFAIGGWVGYTNQRTLSTLDGLLERGSQKIWNWAVTLAFPDLLKEGSVAGILVGMEPKVTSTSKNSLPKDKDTSLHIEGFYQFQLTDNISITPGLIWLTAPDHNRQNSDLLIGVVRTTFTF